MEARWTLAMAREELDTRKLPIDAFVEVVTLVTPDSVLLVENAVHARLGPYYLVWTEHHGNFLEHEDEVLHFRVFRQRTGGG